MRRGGDLKRTKPLARVTALVRRPLVRSALHANSAEQRHLPKRSPATPPRIPTRIRQALAARAGGYCEIGLAGCTNVATDFSHRKKTGNGGRKGTAKAAHDVLSNALAACRFCHSHLHANPAEAYSAGWMLREHQDPVAEPCLYRGERRWLSDDGLVLTTNPTAEEANNV